MSDPTLYRNTIEFQSGNHALVFIHGGAWIDPNNTPNDFESLCKKMLAMDGGEHLGMYGIEYRLSPGVKHPTHLYDVVENLYRLVEEKGIDSIQLVGHSVGATLAWQVATCSGDQHLGNENRLRAVQSKLRAVWLLDGIYSVDQLLQEYPTYNYFVSQAFEPSNQFEEPSESIKKMGDIEVHLVHSYQDELLSLRQTQYMCGLLQRHRLPFTLYLDDLGMHNQVYSNAKLARYIVNNVKII